MRPCVRELPWGDRDWSDREPTSVIGREESLIGAALARPIPRPFALLLAELPAREASVDAASRLFWLGRPHRLAA